MTKGIVVSTDTYHKKASVITDPDTENEKIQIINGVFQVGDEVNISTITPTAEIDTEEIKSYFDELAWRY